MFKKVFSRPWNGAQDFRVSANARFQGEFYWFWPHPRNGHPFERVAFFKEAEVCRLRYWEESAVRAYARCPP